MKSTEKLPNFPLINATTLHCKVCFIYFKPIFCALNLLQTHTAAALPPFPYTFWCYYLPLNLK